MMQRTIEVTHEGTHYPTNSQLRAALNAALKDEDVKIDGDVDYFIVENTSGGTSKVRATFEVVEPQRTKTVGGKKAADPKDKGEDSQ